MNQTVKTPEPPVESRPQQEGALIHKMRNPYWMAPMSGISEVCLRQIMDEMQAGVVISELVSAKGLIYSSGRTRQMIRVHEKPGTLIGVQLFGESADDIVEAARQVAETGAAFLDLNLGCPVKKVVKKGCGSALMRDPAKLETFLGKIKRGIDLPLTVKMRTGWNDAEITIHECVQAAYNAGCEWVAVHGRTRAQGYDGLADWDLIAEVKARAKLPIIGNGDVRSAETARRRLDETGVDAVMIGRGALRNPWIFKQCMRLMTDRRDPAPLELILRYKDLLEGVYETRRTLIYLRKLAAWLAFGYPGAAAFRGRMYQALSVNEVMECAQTFFDASSSLPVPKFEETEAFMMGGHG